MSGYTKKQRDDETDDGSVYAGQPAIFMSCPRVQWDKCLMKKSNSIEPNETQLLY